MRTNKQFESISLTVLLFAAFSTAVMAQDIMDPEPKPPVILATSPAGGEENVDLDSIIEITFSHEMDEESINGTTLQLQATYADTMYEDHSKVLLSDQIVDMSVAIKDSGNSWLYVTDTLGGTITYSNKVAVFTPDSELKEGTLYTFTVTTGVKNLENIAIVNDYTWSFSTIGTSHFFIPYIPICSPDQNPDCPDKSMIEGVKVQMTNGKADAELSSSSY